MLLLAAAGISMYSAFISCVVLSTLISVKLAENCISVERLNTLNTDLQTVLQNKQICSHPTGPFSLIPEAAVHMNFAVKFARLYHFV